MSNPREQFQALLTSMLESTTDEVLERFNKLGVEGALVDTVKNPSWLFMPGSRKEGRLLLVAHADTVNRDSEKVKVEWVGGVARLDPKSFKHGGTDYSARQALGGDDRTGCAALFWLLEQHKAFGHSVLITTGEEGGCVGARSAARIIPEQLGAHAFAVEMDRHGVRNYVFYSRTKSDAFKAHVAKMLPEWEEQLGSSSDIAVICPDVGICGVNIAAGYFGEHTEGEMVVLDVWLDSLGVLSKWAEQAEHPSFKLDKEVPKVVTQYGRPYWDQRDSWGDSWEGAYPREGGKGEKQHTHIFRWQAVCNAMVCQDCFEHMDKGVRSDWQKCKQCRATVAWRREIVAESVLEAEGFTKGTDGKLSQKHRDVFNFALERPYMLSKKMRKRVAKLVSADVRANAPTTTVITPTQPTVGRASPFGSCLVCGYDFRTVQRETIDFCPKCYHNPNFVPPKAEGKSLVVVAQHLCSECKVYVRYDVDHALSCSSYPRRLKMEA